LTRSGDTREVSERRGRSAAPIGIQRKTEHPKRYRRRVCSSLSVLSVLFHPFFSIRHAGGDRTKRLEGGDMVNDALKEREVV